MTGYDFIQYVRLKTRTNPTTFTDLDIILLANVRLETLSKALLGVGEDTLILPMTTNLIAGLREYPFPSSILSNIKYVEAKLDGTNYVPLHEVDLNQMGIATDETSILNNFSNDKGHAAFDINRKAIVIYSGAIVNVVAGLKLWCNIYPAPLNVSRIVDPVTDLSVDPTTTTHGFPRELHELWARGVVIDYKQSREKPIPLTETELNYKNDLRETVNQLKPTNTDREIFANPPAAGAGLAGRWNNGQDI
jgi:hypothetical protein